MANSKARTVVVQSLAGSAETNGSAENGGGGIVANPTTIWTAAQTPLRVLVRNISALGLPVVIAYDQASLQDAAVSSLGFVLPPGVSEVFPLMPGESLYGVSPNVVDALISIVVSDAFPFEAKPVH